MLDLAAYSDFNTAALAALALLHEWMGFDAWMITRSVGDDWVVLETVGRGHRPKRGQTLPWTETFCSRMVHGHGPRIAPRTADVPAYAHGTLGQQFPVGAYVGVPLKRSDGSLFGTLCGIHPEELPATKEQELPVVELVGRLLSTLLDAELKLAEQSRATERAMTEALTDALTGLYNRRGWDVLLAAEDSRCRRYAHKACVVSLDLDNLKQINDSQGHVAGDALLATAAKAMREAVRKQDVVARVGGDEFAVLCVETHSGIEAEVTSRLDRSLRAAGVRASLGAAMHSVATDLEATWRAADDAMYVEKRKHATTRKVT